MAPEPKRFASIGQEVDSISLHLLVDPSTWAIAKEATIPQRELKDTTSQTLKRIRVRMAYVGDCEDWEAGSTQHGA